MKQHTRFAFALIVLLIAGYPGASAQVVHQITPRAAEIGTTVQIVGSGFDPLESYTLHFEGAASAPANAVTTTSLDVTVPAGARSGTFAIETVSTGTRVGAGLPLRVLRQVAVEIDPALAAATDGYVMGTIYAEAGPTALVPVGEPGFVFATDPNDDDAPMLIGVTTETTTTLTLDAGSTAAAIMLFAPQARTADPVVQEGRMPAMAGMAETQALSSAIGSAVASGTDYFADPAFNDLLIDAINAYVPTIPDTAEPSAPPAEESANRAGGGGAGHDDDFVDQSLDFAVGSPVNLGHEGLPLPEKLVWFNKVGGIFVDDNGLSQRRVGFETIQEWRFLPFNPVDWLVEAAEIDPWGGGRFPNGLPDLNSLTNTNEKYRRMGTGNPVGRAVFEQTTALKYLDIFGAVRNYVTPDEAPSIALPSHRPGVYAVRAYSGALEPDQLALIRDLPDGVQAHIEALGFNSFLCAVDLAASALSFEEFLPDGTLRTVARATLTAGRHSLAQAYAAEGIDTTVVIVVIKDTATALVKVITTKFLKNTAEAGIRGAMKGTAKVALNTINIFDKVGTFGKAFQRQEALFHGAIPPYLIPGVQAISTGTSAAAVETAMVAIGDPWAPVITNVSPRKAHQGQTIRIEGKNLRQGIADHRGVDFDGSGGLDPVDPESVEYTNWLVRVPLNAPVGDLTLNLRTTFGEASTSVLSAPDDLFTVLPPPVITSTIPAAPVIGENFSVVGVGFSADRFEVKVTTSAAGPPLTEFSSTSTSILATGLSSTAAQDLQVHILDPGGEVVLSSPPYTITPRLPATGSAGASIAVNTLADNLTPDDFVSFREALQWSISGTTFREPTEAESTQISGTLDAANVARADTIYFPGLSNGDVIQLDPTLGALPWPTSFDTIVSHADVTIDGAAMDADGLVLHSRDNVSVSGVRFRNFGQRCIRVSKTTGATFRNVIAEDCGSDGILLDDGSQRNRFINTGVSNAGGHGIHLHGPETGYNELLYDFGAGSRSAREIRDNTGYGLLVEGGSRFNSLHPGDVLNNGLGGIRISGSPDNSIGYFDRVFFGEGVMRVAGNSGHGVMSDSSGTLVRFLRIGNNSGDGVLFEGADHIGSRVSSCAIGVTWDGLPEGNGGSGIHLRGNVKAAFLGDTYQSGFNVGPPNEIGDNGLHGIWLEGPGVTDTIVSNARIGAGYNSAPSAPIPNQVHGIAVTDGSSDNTIGDRNDATHLEIVGHTNGAGIYLDGYQTTGNVIVGNEIGRYNRPGAWIAFAEDAALGNLWGVRVTNGAWDNKIGLRGDDAFETLALETSVTDSRNRIYASLEAGILLESGGDPSQSFPATGAVTPRGANVVQNNTIGAVGVETRNQYGIVLRGNGLANRIGGTHGSEANFLYGNAKAGIWIDSLITSNPNLANRIVANRIGFSEGDHIAPEPLDEITDGVGILVTNSQNQKIGGTTLEEANWFIANQVGIQIDSSTSIEVEVNYIGYDWRARHEIAGIIISDSTGCTIKRNQILGNAYHAPAQGRGGLSLVGGGNHRVQGNYFGTSPDMVQNLANAPWGILIRDSADNVIGGSGEGDSNVIVKSHSDGIRIEGAGASRNLLVSNWIGVRPQDLSASANLGAGVLLTGGANDNSIGGDTPLTIDAYSTSVPGANVIQSNGTGGIVADGPTTTGNKYLNNSISGHSGPPIRNLNGANGAVVPPVIHGVTGGVVDGTTTGVSTGSRVQVFSDAGDEGGVWVGDTTTEPDGSWEAALMGSFDTQLRATVTDAATGSTSELGGAFTLPATLEIVPDPDVVPLTAIPTGSGDIVALPLLVRAHELSGEVAALTIRTSGTLHDVAGIAAVRIYRDLDADGAVGEDDLLLGGPELFSADDGFAQLSLSHSRLASGSTHRWLVTFDLAQGATVGTTFEFEITAASDVDGRTVYAKSPLPVAGSFPITSGPMTVLAGSGLANQRLLTVSDDPADGANFIDLQTAIDTAGMESTRIELLPGLTGTYAGNLTVNAPWPVTVTGDDQVVLDGMGGTAVTVLDTSAKVGLVGLTLTGATGLSASANTILRGVTFQTTVLGAELLAGNHAIDESLWHAGTTGIRVAAAANLKLRSCEMHEQAARSLEVLGIARVESCVIAGSGTGIWADHGADVTILGSTIADQVLSGVEAASGATVSIDGSILWDNVGIDYLGGSCDDVAYSIVGSPDCSGTNHNLWADPIFTRSLFEPFRLDPASPAIEAGTPASSYDGSPAFDVTGDLRLRDYDWDLDAAQDMGAYEHAPAQPLIEVAGLTFGDKDTLAWTAVAGTAEYHLYRGSIPGLGYDDFGTCRDDLDPDRTDTEASDPGTPPDWTTWFYLVTADDGTGEGSLGEGHSAERSLFSACP